MKSGFVPYVEKSVQVLLPLLDYFYHDGVRMSAMSAVPHLINAVKIHREQNKMVLVAPLERVGTCLIPSAL